MNILYSASVTAAKGGRTGNVTSADGQLNMNLAMPKELGGPGGEGTNPEQLFAAGYSACFHSAIGLVARMKKISITGYEVTARVSIGEDSDGGFALETIMDVKIPDVALKIARELVEAAHQVCPYSKATRGNMSVEFNVIN